MTKPWRIAVDTGGTFTDCIAIDPEGNILTRKVMSNASLRGYLGEAVEAKKNEWAIQQHWNTVDDFPVGFRLHALGDSTPLATVTGFSQTTQGSLITLDCDLSEEMKGCEVELISGLEAPVLAAHLITQTPANQPLPKLEMRLATTRGTNALLEGKGIPPTLFITMGFGDLLEIGNQSRPDLFALNVIKPKPLTGRVIEVDERLDADGNVLKPIDLESLKKQIDTLSQEEKRSCAIAFLHSYLNPVHELEVEKILKEAGVQFISVSSQLAPSIRILDRAQTTVANAYLAPIINTYLDEVKSQLGTESLLNLTVMTSAGGLLGSDHYLAKDSLLSGPAGGVVGAATSATAAGFSKAISFDMGGTSTDVSRYDGDYPFVTEHRVGNANLLSPALDIHTVAAGGGSICRVEHGHLLVGPESAGSRPGPACYGAGGPLAITDVNLLLGRIFSEAFDIPIRTESARAIAEQEFEKFKAANPKTNYRLENLLEGFLALANQEMANAVRRISINQGYDPKSYALVSFGGAGSQHACGVAELLGMQKIIVPLNASLLSAEGLLHARLERFAMRQYLRPYSDFLQSIENDLHDLEQQVFGELESEGLNKNDCVIRQRIVDLRLQGQDSSISVSMEDPKTLPAQFAESFKKLYGYEPPDRELEVVQLKVLGSESTHVQDFSLPDKKQANSDQSVDSKSVFECGEWHEVRHYQESSMSVQSPVMGPCLIEGRNTVIFVASNWQAHKTAQNQILMEKAHANN